MSIIRTAHRENPYAQIDKRVFSDVRISWQAKGLLGYLLSQPPNWQVNVKNLINQSPNGRDSVYSILKELTQAGYVTTSKRPVVQGKFAGLDYMVYETPRTASPYPVEPDTVSPDTVQPDTAPPDTEKPDVNNNEVNNTDFTNNDFTNNEERNPDEVSPGPSKPLKAKKQKPADPATHTGGAAKNELFEIYNEWFLEEVGAPPKMLKKDWVGLHQLKQYLGKLPNAKTADAPAKALGYILANWKKLEPYLQKQKDLSQINSNINAIIDQLKNGQPKRQPANKLDLQSLDDAASAYNFSGIGK